MDSPSSRKSGSHQTPRIVDTIDQLIGRTPLLRMDPAKTGLKNIDLYAKLEHLNPFGSIKDRTALGMLGPHIARLATEKKTVLELSSGNAARGLQALSSIYGVQTETVSNRIRIPEMRKVLQIQGAQITPINNIDNTDAYAALHFVDQKAAHESDRYFYTDQYRNPANDGTHAAQTGQEIVDDLGAVDYFIGAIGTAGSTVGISRRLRDTNVQLDVTGVVSEKTDFIPGIRHQDEVFDVGAFHQDKYNRISDVTSQDAIQGVLDLVRLYGVMAGPSSGATYCAALRFLKSVDADLTERKSAVFVVFDRLELYLSYIEERRPDLFA